ncbi:hypothetical protein ACJX0J_019189, partial [Zea mays]
MNSFWLPNTCPTFTSSCTAFLPLFPHAFLFPHTSHFFIALNRREEEDEEEEHILRDTRGVTLEEKLGMFLFMLSHNASYEDLQHEFKHSGETIHRHIQSVFHIIPSLMYRF